MNVTGQQACAVIFELKAEPEADEIGDWGGVT